MSPGHTPGKEVRVFQSAVLGAHATGSELSEQACEVVSEWLSSQTMELDVQV